MKSVIVTGASSGIGYATAHAFLAAGWTVGLVARRVDKLEAIAARYDTAFALPCDVTEEPEVTTAFQAFVDQVGRLDVLFNNAGVFTDLAPIDEVPVADWHKAVAVNLTGMFLCARAAFGLMRRQDPKGGRIINNGSISAYVPREGSVTYTTTKHGVTGLTRTLALDGREFDIACGQIDIGNTETPMLTDLAERARAEGKEPPLMFDVDLTAQAVLNMAALPPNANVLFQTIMATKMPYVGRG